MPKSILRRFPRHVPQKERDTKVVMEFVKQVERVDSIPSFLRCARAIDTHSSSIFKILERNPQLELLVYNKIRRKIFSLDEETFLDSLRGKYPDRIRKFMYERLKEILISHVMNDQDVLLITPLLKKLHIDFKTYQHLIEYDPEVEEILDDLIGKKILLLNREDMLEMSRKVHTTFPQIRFAIDLGFQRILIQEMVKSKEFRYSVVARRINSSKDRVLHLKKHYPVFCRLLSDIKEEWFFDMIRGYRLDRINIRYIKGWDYRTGDYLLDINRWTLERNKLFAIYHLLSYWSERRYMLSHMDYFYMMKILLNINPDTLEKLERQLTLNSSNIALTPAEARYNEMFNRYIKEIRWEYGHFSSTELLIGLYYVSLLIPYSGKHTNYDPSIS